MSIGRLVKENATLKNGLGLELLLEYTRSVEGKSKETQPVIIFESPRWTPNITHVYVIWDKFQDLKQEDRSDIILEFYDTVKGSTEGVSLTLGLTEREARKLGLKYEVINDDSHSS